jgi:hypothetical protein
MHGVSKKSTVCAYNMKPAENCTSCSYKTRFTEVVKDVYDNSMVSLALSGVGIYFLSIYF